MKIRELNKIIIPKWGVSPYKETVYNKNVFAFDSETYKGKVSIMGVYGSNDFSDFIIPYSADSLLRFLTRKIFCKSHNFFFNLKYDRDAIIKMLPDSCINNLRDFDMCFYNNFRIKLIGNKSFTISRVLKNDIGYKIRQTAFFSDIASFYRSGSLSNTVRKALKMDYVKSIDIGSGVAPENIDRDIVSYCLEDCYYTFLLSKNIVDLSGEFVSVRRFYSPASISKAFLKKSFSDGYLFKKTKIQDYALRGYAGGRFEILKKGRFDDIFMADINSAYPYQISKLYNPNGIHVFKPEYIPDSLYSYFRADVKIPDNFVYSPFKYMIQSLSNLLVFPTGFFKNVFLSKIEYETLIDMDCKVKIRKGIHILNDDPVLWLDNIASIYYRRCELKDLDDPREHVLKLMLNSLYGITIQTAKNKVFLDSWSDSEENNADNSFVSLKGDRFLVKEFWKAGSWFNPLIASEITARTRCMLYNDFKDFEDNIVMVATDSVCMDKPLPVKDSRELGGYKHYNRTSGIVFANGIYEFDNRQAGRRGLVSDIHFSLKDLFKGCVKDNIVLTKTRPKSLKECLPPQVLNRDPNSLINIFLPYSKTIRLDMDRKRVWDGEFSCFNDVLNGCIDSQPLQLSVS